MRIKFWTWFVLAALVVSPSLASAQGEGEEMPGAPGGEGNYQQGQGSDHGRGHGPMGMMKGMMGMMRPHASMVSAADGGVIVLAGNKLLKYDTNLKLVKEQTIPMDSGMNPGMKPPMKHGPNHGMDEGMDENQGMGEDAGAGMQDQ